MGATHTHPPTTQILGIALDPDAMARELSKTERETDAEFEKLLEEERQAIADHQLALTLAGLSIEDPQFVLSSTYATNLSNDRSLGTNEQWARAKELYAEIHAYEMGSQTSTESDETSDTEEEGAYYDSEPYPEEPLTLCEACLDKIPTIDTLTLECKPVAHSYCRICLHNFFIRALEDVSIFPPKCCNIPIPLDVCRTMLPQGYVKKFDLKVEELATPNPTYYANIDCTAFIRVKDISADIGTCIDCNETTCVQCKHRAHDGLCPSDPHVQLLMDAAKRAKWQQCAKCRNMVELSQGCFHMYCRCGHEFCYLCGVHWKTCRCPQWDEEFLTRPDPVGQPAPAPEPEPAEHLHVWQRLTGGNCEDCRADWLRFVMYCGGCGVTSCWRCIGNLH